jgi:hypothetical protein
MNFTILWLILTAAAAPTPPGLVEASHGSLVVAIVSQKADYVVVAAESRETDHFGRFIGDTGCKIIALGGDTLFFEAGTSSVVIQGEYRNAWHAQALARSVYRRNRRHDALGLSTKWGADALLWFNALSETDLSSVPVEKGRIITGGFVNFTDDGDLPVRTQLITFSPATRHAERNEDIEPTAPGRVAVLTVNKELTDEFFRSSTNRVRQALVVLGQDRNIGVDAAVDAILARGAIQFVMDNATAEDKAKIGGPIDVAVLRRGGAVVWVSRKKSCYQQDFVK